MNEVNFYLLVQFISYLPDKQYAEKFCLCEGTANSPNHTRLTCKGAEVTHFDHGRCKVTFECGWILAVISDNVICGAAAEKDLICFKKSLLLHYILVVVVVK